MGTLGQLLRDICDRREIPRRADHIVGHADAHPVDRTSGGESWDPPKSVFTPAVARQLLEAAA